MQRITCSVFHFSAFVSCLCG